MRIIHIPFSYYPDMSGGTEVYVRALAREQKRLGHEVMVVAPGRDNKGYKVDDIPVARFRVNDNVPVDEVYVRTDSVDLVAFKNILDGFAPTVVHVHGYTPVVSREMVQLIKRRGSKLVFTYHVATATCVRGTLMRFGQAPCSGVLDAQLCAACKLQAGGLPTVLAQLVTKMPTPQVGTALRMKQLVARRHAEIVAFFQQVDVVVAPSQWVLDLLLRLPVPREKIVLLRQGVYQRAAEQAQTANEELAIAYLGRMDVTKGVDVLLKAFRRVTAKAVRLDIYSQKTESAYAKDVRALAARDSQVRLMPPLDPDQIIDTLQQYDVLAVPSQTAETGPLVVLEAFEAGVPVIGSRIAGIDELVKHGSNGLLVEHDDVAGWASAIQGLADDREKLAALRSGLSKPMSMVEVASQMLDLYQ